MSSEPQQPLLLVLITFVLSFDKILKRGEDNIKGESKHLAEVRSAYYKSAPQELRWNYEKK